MLTVDEAEKMRKDILDSANSVGDFFGSVGDFFVNVGEGIYDAGKVVVTAVDDAYHATIDFIESAVKKAFHAVIDFASEAGIPRLESSSWLIFAVCGIGGRYIRRY